MKISHFVLFNLHKMNIDSIDQRTSFLSPNFINKFIKCNLMDLMFHPPELYNFPLDFKSMIFILSLY